MDFSKPTTVETDSQRESATYSSIKGYRTEEKESSSDDKSDHCTSAELSELSLNDPTRELVLPPSLPFLNLPQMTFDFEETITIPPLTSFSTTKRYSILSEESSTADSTSAYEAEEVVTEKLEETPVLEEVKIVEVEEEAQVEQIKNEEPTEAEQVEIEVEELRGLDYHPVIAAFTMENASNCSLETTESPRQRDLDCEFVALNSTLTVVQTELLSDSMPSPRRLTILEAWTGFPDQSSSFDRRLFGLLGLCALVQTAAELFLIALFLTKKAYVALGIAAIFAFPLSLFGILASRSRGKRYLGLYSGAMILWQTWATLHVTLMIYRPLKLVTELETHNMLANAFISQDEELRGFSIFIFSLYSVHLFMCIIAVVVILSWFLFPTQSRPHWELNKRNLRPTPTSSSALQELRESLEEAKPQTINDFIVEEKKVRASSQSLTTKIKSWIVHLKTHSGFANLKRCNTVCRTINTQTSRASNASIFFHTANSKISSLVQTRPSSWLNRNSTIEPQHAVDNFPKKFGGSLPANLNYLNIQPNFNLDKHQSYTTPRPPSDHWSQSSGGNLRKSLPPSLVSDQEGASALPSPISYTASGYSNSHLRMPLTPIDSPSFQTFDRQDRLLPTLARPKPAILGRSFSLLHPSAAASKSPSPESASRRHSDFSHLPAHLFERSCPSLPTIKMASEKRIPIKSTKPHIYRHRPSPLYT
ncbi:hypothetical protein DSO57_1002092 [Entomophthora muscae]|uniref:Uncharacterized protein n=1 Tax=Entomophthora muscae TaxID=34485 RepID=A0ACC2S002_9FUNG|nr:hypothetical protein DSO57_1002092 [Entomophthora muscae]